MTLTTQAKAIQELAKGVKRKRKGVHEKKAEG
jgi:predicted transcriptional regulator